MEPRSERFTTSSLDGVHLHALHWGERNRGDAPTLVLLHGGGANAHWWDHVAPAFCGTRHVVALDFRGHGDSDYPEELATGAFSVDLEALCEHFGGEPIALLGHSMGAGVAVAHAADVGAVGGDAASAVRALVAVDLSRGASRRSRRTARLALMLRRTYETRDEAIARYRFLPGSDHAAESLRVAIAEHSVCEQPDGRFGFKFDPRWFGVPSRPAPDLGQIACPTLFVRGGESPMLSEEGAQALLDDTPGARLVSIDGAGHHVQLDQPERFTRAATAFLEEALAR
jgi:pimeloyl-ACP methyl ester carboxylesterase